MRFAMLITLAGLACIGCGPKSSDADLFEEGPIKIDLSASGNRGYRPFLVNFTAYLERDDKPYETEINEVKWVIRGPRGFEREIVNDSLNLQEDEDNTQSLFYLEYQFNLPGRFYIQLQLNEGEFNSRRYPIRVLDQPDENRPRF